MYKTYYWFIMCILISTITFFFFCITYFFAQCTKCLKFLFIRIKRNILRHPALNKQDSNHISETYVVQINPASTIRVANGFKIYFLNSVYIICEMCILKSPTCPGNISKPELIFLHDYY